MKRAQEEQVVGQIDKVELQAALSAIDIKVSNEVTSRHSSTSLGKRLK